MQRSSISNSRYSTDDHRSINIAAEQQQQQNAKRRRNTDDDSLDLLPVYHHRAAAVRRDVSRSRSPSPDKMIHAIPLLVLLCLFTLWWFSFPDVEIKDGTITTIRQLDTPISTDHTRFDLTILAVAASSPIASIPQDVSGEDEIYLPPASSPN